MAESQTPQGVLAVAHSAAALTGLPGARDWPGLGAAYRRGMRLILVINIPAAVGLVVLAEPIDAASLR